MKQEELTLRIESALRELPLSEQQIAEVLPRMQQIIMPDFGKSLCTDSGFFAFKDKITTLVDHFKKEGLTLENYLQAALKQPPLFYRSPDTVESNIRRLVQRFEQEGLTAEQYLQAALKQSQLFYQLPDTVESNIRTLAQRFEKEGLTAEKYLQAALKQPSLFSQSPDTVEGNIRRLVQRFEKEGLTAEKYLQAALKQPSLFCRSPDTIAGHINQVIDMYRRQVFHLNGKTRQEHPESLKPLFDFLLTTPAILCLADTNFTLRQLASVAAPAESNSAYRVLQSPRGQMEERLASALGHADQDIPVPKTELAETNTVAYARNLLLRALVREGIVRGSLAQAGNKGRAC